MGDFKDDCTKIFDFDPFIESKRFTQPTFASQFNKIANPPLPPSEQSLRYPIVDLKRYLLINNELNVEKRAKDRIQKFN